MQDQFIAVDVETANPDLASICQVGIVTFTNGEPCCPWESLINPQDYFDPWNVAIHGIGEDDVANAPAFPQVFPTLHNLLAHHVVVSHMPFDKLALGRAAERYGWTSPGFVDT